MLETPEKSTKQLRAKPSRGVGRTGLLSFVERYALVVLTLGLIAFFSFLPSTSDTFFSMANLRVTANGQSVLIVVGIAALIPLICRQYDFSVGATSGLAAVLAAGLLSGGASLPVAILVALAIGLGIGLINGLLVTVVRVDSVVVTLGMTTIISGLVGWKTSGNAIVSGIPSGLTSLSDTLAALPATTYIALGLAVFAFFVLAHTQYGRYLQAIGSNPGAARLVGIGTKRLTLSAFLFAGALAGLAGLMELAVSGAGNPQVGPNYTLPAIAASFLSVAAIRPGFFNVPGLIVAITFLAALNSGLNLSGVDPFVNDLANGSALIIGVAVAALLGRRRNAAIEA